MLVSSSWVLRPFFRALFLHWKKLQVMFFIYLVCNFFFFQFYNDFTPILLRYQQKVSDLVFARKTEREELSR